MTDIVEAMARAMWQVEWGTATWPPAEDPRGAEAYRALARAAAACVLEHAASMAEEYFSDNTISGVSPQWVADEIAAMIRSFKEQP